MTSTTLSHAWRFARLFGLTFGGAAATNLLHLPAADKTAVLGAVVAAVEVAYRKMVPGNPNGIQWIGQLFQAFKVISSVNAPVASAVGPGPVVGPAGVTPAAGPVAGPEGVVAGPGPAVAQAPAQAPVPHPPL